MTPSRRDGQLLPPRMSLAEIEALVEDLIVEGLVYRDAEGALYPTEKCAACRAGAGVN